MIITQLLLYILLLLYIFTIYFYAYIYIYPYCSKDFTIIIFVRWIRVRSLGYADLNHVEKKLFPFVETLRILSSIFGGEAMID